MLLWTSARDDADHGNGATARALRSFERIACVLIAASLASTAFLSRHILAQPASDPGNLLSNLAEGFLQPPAEARPLTWWHWINGCVTREGITADLEAMKRIGLGGAQLFSVQLTTSQLFSVQSAMQASQYREVKGEVQFMSPQWRELVRHALAECNRLGLELSILNCEGWGQAGGQWVTPAESMQKVVWTEAQIVGGQNVALTTKRPVAESQYCEDIALLAFPTMPGDDNSAAPTITASATMSAEQSKTPDSEAPLFTMPLPMPGKPQWAQLDFGRPRAFSSVYIAMNDMRDISDPDRWENSPFLNAAGKKSVSEMPGPHYWELQVSDDGREFRSVGRISTHGTSSFPETEGRFFRVWMPVPPPLQKPLPLAETEPMQITRITLGGPRLDRPEIRTGQYIDWRAREFSGAKIPPANVISRARVVNLTGRKEWDAPPGKWTLLRLSHVSTGTEIVAAGTGGLEVDKLSRKAVLKHLTHGMIGAVLADAGPLAGKTLKNILCDSWERGYENWTPLMREEFEKRRGYSPDAWLPALTGRVVDSSDASERFLWDFRRTLADLVADNYYGTLRDYAHQHNLGVYAEATGHFLPTIADQLQCKGRVDVPMGEFWSGGREIDDTKEAASAAHIYGKRVAAAESFTARADAGSWSRDPFALKPEADLRFCMGINRLCFHRFAHQPWMDRQPGMTMGKWGTELERTNTWWELAGPWIDYLARCQFLLQRGQFVADVCYFYGEDAPVDFSFKRLDPSLPEGFDFDACNAEILVNQMTVKDGRLTLPSGMSYRALVLPDNDRMTPSVIRAVQKLVHDGATVVGPKPTKSPSLSEYPECDRTVQEIADQVWGDCDGRTITSHRYGAGWIRCGEPLSQTIGVMPDFASDDPNLRFIHRRDEDAEIYFIANERKQETLAKCTFRVNGLVPELWYPDTGRRETAAMYWNNGDRITVPIHLDPAGSVFVVFRRSTHPDDPIVAIQEQRATMSAAEAGSMTTFPMASPPGLVNGNARMTMWQAGTYTFKTRSGKTVTASTGEMPRPMELTGPWNLRFPPKLGAPPTVTLEQLGSWTDSKDPGTKYFSGTATYLKAFNVTSEQRGPNLRLYLDLGVVKNLCEVTLNGHNLGTLWKPPFRIDITGAVQTGTNHLAITVTNLWPNRLIGDLTLPEEKRVTWTTYSPYLADSPLLASGLLGPVILRTARFIDVIP